jgi:hypothetical protein
MRLIDADLLTNGLKTAVGEATLKGDIKPVGFENYVISKLIEVIDAVPTIDPIKHGKWIINSDGFYPYCSECGFRPERYMTRYCPGCGRRMDGE